MTAAEISEKYTPQKAADIARGMLTPQDRIACGRLSPETADYRKALDMARRAGVVEDMDVKGFIDDRFALATVKQRKKGCKKWELSRN